MYTVTYSEISVSGCVSRLHHLWKPTVSVREEASNMRRVTIDSIAVLNESNQELKLQEIQ